MAAGKKPNDKIVHEKIQHTKTKIEKRFQKYIIKTTALFLLKFALCANISVACMCVDFFYSVSFTLSRGSSSFMSKNTRAHSSLNQIFGSSFWELW